MITRLDSHSDQAGAWDVLRNATGDLCFDIGANIGQSTKVLAKGFKRVIAFEPCLESFDILQVEMPQNVTPVQIAVSSRTGDIVLCEAAHSITTGQLVTGEGLAWGALTGSRKVPARALNRLVTDFGMPDFIKIDTEGHEVEIVRGGLECLRAVPSFIIEIHKEENEELIRELLPKTQWVKLTHAATVHPAFVKDHFWIVGTNGT